MPVNRNALVRYKTIDQCLQNRFRKWTLEDLIDACSDALYEYEGIDKGVSKRTVQMDIQFMRSDKLGYNAPIIVTDKKYYSYEEEDYSITNIPLTDQDLGKLTEVVEILREFKGFTHFRELSGIVQKLEDKVNTSKTQQRSIIDFEKNDYLKGIEHIDSIYKAIQNRRTININYQSFKARKANDFIFHPFLLKEYRNRWFVLGKKDSYKIQNPILLALDRIENITTSPVTLMSYNEDEIKDYFKNVIGVTVNTGDKAEEIIFYADWDTAPYIITKPLHHSQKIIEQNNFGITFYIHVKHNYELEREILGFGDRIKIIKPLKIKRRIKDIIENTNDLYNTELDYSTLKNLESRVDKRGTAVINNVYTKREIRKIGNTLHNYINHSNKDKHQPIAIRQLLIELPILKTYLFNENLKLILKFLLGKDYFLSKAIFFNKPPLSNWYVTWHQDQTINLSQKIEMKGFTGWTKKGNVISVCPPEEILHNTISLRIHLDETNENNGGLRIIAGSHKKRLSDEELSLITQNTVAARCNVIDGGIHIMKPLLLHASSKSKNQKKRRVIHLEFTNAKLPNGLEWSEKIELN